MSSSARRLMLAIHVAVSVGWIGALAAFVVLAVVGQLAQDANIRQSAYLAMDIINRFVIVPAALISVLTGIVQSLGTSWGLFRHYWVLFKLAIIVTATAVLLMKTAQISYVAEVAAQTALAASDLTELRLSILVHSVGGSAVLLWAMLLGIYKPKAVTPFARD